MPNINFKYLSKHAFEVCEKPRPASHFIPEWHKNMPSYSPTPTCPAADRLSLTGGGTNVTAKKCIPMLDSISSGYIVPLWADIVVEQSQNGPLLNWLVEDSVFSLHGSSYVGMTPPPSFSHIVFKYMTYFRMETPNGYSVQVRPPAGHYNLPIQVIPAIIDTDRSVIDSNFPCWIKKDFEGIIKKGTPVAQVIPFKRENWKSEFSYITEDQFSIQLNKGFLSTVKNNYVENIWSRKKYE